MVKLHRGYGEPDMLSELPDELISHILSFLPVKVATGAKLLSRRWRHLYPDNPTLKFATTDFPGRYEDERDVWMGNFVAWVDKCLRQFRAPKIAAIKLFLAQELVADYAHNVDEWIRLACGMKVESIVLQFFCSDRNGKFYIFPFHRLCLGELSHLRHLSLHWCRLPAFTALDGPITSLRGLEFYVVSFSESNGNFADIPSYCPNLESLSFMHCRELPSMPHLCGQLNYLKALEIWFCRGSQDLEFHDVNLTDFKYGIDDPLDISFKGLNCLRSISITARCCQKNLAFLLSNLLEGAPQLESLSLTLREVFQVPAFASTFKCLKYLRLGVEDVDAQNLSKVLQMAPLLQKLEIAFHRPTDSEQWSPKCLEEQLQQSLNRPLHSQPQQHSLLKEIGIWRVPYLQKNDFELAIFLLMGATSPKKMTFAHVEGENHERVQRALAQYKIEVILKPNPWFG